MNLKFKRTGAHTLPLPARGTRYSAGLDLSANGDYEIPPDSRLLIKTGWMIEIPNEHYGRIAPRSGLALKKGIDVLAGVIDIDYRGELGVILFNTAGQSFSISHGDKIAQLIIERCSYLNPVEVEILDDTERANGGFGSTDKE